jgi:hypothetical protein
MQRSPWSVLPWSSPHVEDLGTLAGSFSVAETVSPTGKVFGVSQTAGAAIRMFSWTPVSGMVDRGAPPGTEHISVPMRTSSGVSWDLPQARRRWDFHGPRAPLSSISEPWAAL